MRRGGTWIAQLLHQAGLSPLEITKIGTLNRDPTADVDATADIAMVMHRGFVVDRQQLPVAGKNGDSGRLGTWPEMIDIDMKLVQKSSVCLAQLLAPTAGCRP